MKDVTGQHAAEIEQLRIKLAAAEQRITDSQRTISQAEITKVGHVYVISNIGSFGTEVFKIGMTRRLDPNDRIIELGDASVPFPFDVHMMIKTEDAPNLERKLHRRFHKRRVNRANFRKEFFRVSIDEVLEAVRSLHGEVQYQLDPVAMEYRDSQVTSEEELEELVDIYDEAEKLAEENEKIEND